MTITRRPHPTDILVIVIDVIVDLFGIGIQPSFDIDRDIVPPTKTGVVVSILVVNSNNKEVDDDDDDEDVAPNRNERKI
jgi:hypothetical protein